MIAAALLGRASCGNAQNLDAARGADGRALVTSEIEAQTASTASSGLDLNVIAAADVLEMPRRLPKLSLEDLDLVISDPKLLPPGVEASPMHSREYPYLAPGMDAPGRVSTDPDYYEENSDSIELRSPGNPLIPIVEAAEKGEQVSARSIREILSKGQSSKQADLG